MSYDVYRYIFIGGLVLSVVMLIATVLIFFLLNIKNAIGDITGTNKKKGIQNINNKNVKKDTVKSNNASSSLPSDASTDSAETSKISPQDRYDTMEASETSILSSNDSSNNEVYGVVHSACKLEEIKISDPDFCVETEITYVHSAEVIR